MFSFFKQKPKLKDIIPRNYIDIHSHILPGIDDGSKNLEDTLFLTNAMKKLGFEKCITTPHIIQGVWNNTHEIIQTLEQKTIIDFKNNNHHFTVKAAAEYLMDLEFLKLFQKERLLTIKDDYVLVEMSYINAPMQLYEILFELQIAGYKPILAHPERYLFYFSNFENYTKLKNAGCLFQLNLLSSVGYYGEGVLKLAIKLLENGMIDFVGSDIHHERHVNAFNLPLQLKNSKALEEAFERNNLFNF